MIGINFFNCLILIITEQVSPIRSLISMVSSINITLNNTTQKIICRRGIIDEKPIAVMALPPNQLSAVDIMPPIIEVNILHTFYSFGGRFKA